jgi:hypothetical protein
VKPDFYFVTRQSYWHEEGAYAVELCIAPSMDYTSPGMLVSRPGIPDGGEFDDPREAAREALDIALAWPECEGRVVIASGYGLQMVYPGIDDPDVTFSPVQALMWADAEYERLPKCEECGEPGREYTANETGDNFIACGDTHADDYIARNYYAHEEDLA